MRPFSLALLGAAALMSCAPTSAVAQRNRSRGGGLNTNFARGPAVGELLPDVSAFDSDGKPFKLRSLKGGHAVIVFGCLT